MRLVVFHCDGDAQNAAEVAVLAKAHGINAAVVILLGDSRIDAQVVSHWVDRVDWLLLLFSAPEQHQAVAAVTSILSRAKSKCLLIADRRSVPLRREFNSLDVLGKDELPEWLVTITEASQDLNAGETTGLLPPRSEVHRSGHSSPQEDSPLLDLTNPSVKRLLKAGKQRGYVTHDELNAVLPSQEVTPDQIEDMMAMLSEMGISVVEQDEDADEGEVETLAMPIEEGRMAFMIGDEEDSHLGDFIEDRNAILPIDAAIRSNLRETTTRVLASLTPREERILRMRFGVGIGTDHTLEEVGEQFSITRERLRQIEAKALRKLKHPSRSGKLRSFGDNDDPPTRLRSVAADGQLLFALSGGFGMGESEDVGSGLAVRNMRDRLQATTWANTNDEKRSVELLRPLVRKWLDEHLADSLGGNIGDANVLRTTEPDIVEDAAPNAMPKEWSRSDDPSLANSAPQRQPDIVNCSVFAPHSAAPGRSVLVQAFLHQPEQAVKVNQLATLMDAGAEHRGEKTFDTEIPRGATVEVKLTCDEIDIDEPVQTLVWRGQPVFCQFIVTMPKQHGLTVLPVAQFTIGGIPIGRIVFSITCTGAVSEGAPNGLSAIRYRRAFVSYAATDRAEVVKRTQMLRAVGINVFMDILNLDPGARWEKELYRQIDECDVLYLFWSSAAKESEWVIKEAEYALARRGDSATPDVIPVIIESPPPLPPPPSLASLHFNDALHPWLASV